MSKKENGSPKEATKLKNVVRVSGKQAGIKTVGSSSSAEAIASGFPPRPDLDLTFQNGKTIPDLSFVNCYVGNKASWDSKDPNDVNLIDSALAAAMSDKNLNNVLLQYFPGRDNITSTFLHSQYINLDAPPPPVFDNDTVENLVRDLYSGNMLGASDFNNTAFNFILPSGIELVDKSGNGDAKQTQEKFEEAGTSTKGLGGYHHLIVKENVTIYYGVVAYSEMLSDQESNGIVAFDKPWKNIAAVLYHELNEIRTDPDVNTPGRALGWYSDKGGEIGDIPIEMAMEIANGDLNIALPMIFTEVQLTNGTGTVPIQLQYSKAVHGPEGPIPAPH